MVRIAWTNQALNDIDSICEFIAKDSSHYARIFASKVFDSVERLKEFPTSGRVVPEMNDQKIREIIFGNHRISAKEVEILTVHHSARLLNPPIG